MIFESIPDEETNGENQVDLKMFAFTNGQIKGALFSGEMFPTRVKILIMVPKPTLERVR